MSSPKVLYILRRAPYSGPEFAEAIDAALVGGVFEQQLSVLFVDDAVFALVPDQDGAEIGQRTVGKMLQALSDYDVEDLYACASSLAARNIDANEFPVPVKTIDEREQAQLIGAQQVVLSV